MVTVTVSYYDSDKRTLIRGNQREKIRLKQRENKAELRETSFVFPHFTAIILTAAVSWLLLNFLYASEIYFLKPF